MVLTPDIILQNWVFEKNVVEALVHESATKNDLTVLLQSSPEEIIRNETKIALLETIQRDFQLLQDISYTFTSDIDTVMIYIKNSLWKILFHFRSGDFWRKKGENTEKAFCYERSIAYMIAWYHRAMDLWNESLAKKMTHDLAKYIGDKNLASIYLNDASMQEDALRYFASLKKPTQIKTADIVPYRIIDWTVQILLWTRDHFPTGTATLGGFVDFERDHEDIVSDSEIAELYDFPDITIVTALREWIEEAWKKVKHLVHTRTYGKTTDGVYRIEQWDMRLEIHRHEKIDENTFIEDPVIIEEPADSRGLVSSVFYVARLVSWTAEWSDDVGEVDWFDLDSIDDHHFAMSHHKEFLEKMRNEKRDGIYPSLLYNALKEHL
jgi:hypothetical protein